MADRLFPAVSRTATVATTADVTAAQSAAATDATNKVAAATGLPPSVIPIIVGGLIAGYKEVNGAAFNAATCYYTGDVLTSIVTTNPAKTYTFSYTNGNLTGMAVS